MQQSRGERLRKSDLSKGRGIALLRAEEDRHLRETRRELLQEGWFV